MCDTLVAIWPDGVGFAKNSDRDPNEAQFVQWLPAMEYPKGAQLRCTWMVIPQVRRTQAVLLSRPFWTWGAEMGANAAGLVIGNEAVFTKSKFDEPGLTGLDLVRLTLERATCVDQAIEVLSSLLLEHGQGGRASYSHPAFRYHNSFLIADPSGAAVLETSGRQWAVQRVPSGVRAISNGLTLPALSQHADRLREAVAECKVRRARMETLGARSLPEQIHKGLHGTTDAATWNAARAQSLANALRDHGCQSSCDKQETSQLQTQLQGTEHVDMGDGIRSSYLSSWQTPPRYRRLNGALSAPCVHFGGALAGSQTVASWISVLSPQGVQHWITGTSAPCLSLFRPVSLEQSRDVGQPEGQPDSNSLWWRFEKVHREAIKDWNATSTMRQQRDDLERLSFQTPSDQDAHWRAADQWLEHWSEHLVNLPDRRPRWLSRRWKSVQLEADGGNRMPPWN